jgi:hypothetical protein
MLRILPFRRNRVLAVIALAALAACAKNTGALATLSLDQTREDVLERLGRPDAVRGAIRNKYGQAVEVWQYELSSYSGSIKGLSPYTQQYWLYFVDGVLAQWGQAGDWEAEADRIYEVRFR